MKKIIVYIMFFYFGVIQASINKRLVDKTEDYLNKITGISSDFYQMENKKKVTGKLYLLRPGKIKLTYDNKKIELIADGKDLYFIDNSINQITTIPLKSSPAAILLRQSINLQSGDIKVINTKDYKDNFSISLQLQKQEGLGTLTLFFAKNPVKLYAWNIKDALENETFITFESFITKTDFEKDFFKVKKHITVNNSDGDSFYE